MIESTVPIVAQSVGTKDNDNDDSTVLMPLDSVILNVDSDSDRKLRLDSTTTVETFTAVTSSVAGTALVTPGEESKAFMKVFTSSNAADIQYHLTGDGDGTDAVQGVGTNTIGNRYIIPHAVGGVQILSTEAAIISCSQMNNDGTLTPFFAVNHSAATIESPLGFSTGSTQSGYIANSVDSADISQSLSSKGLYIEGTGNFALRTNTVDDDEYTPLGFRSGVTTSYNQNVRYFFEPVNTSVITGDRIQTGKIQSNNLSTTVGSEFNLNDGTFKLGGTSNPNLSFDGTTLIVSGTVSSSVGNIGGFTIDSSTLKSKNNKIIIDSDSNDGKITIGDSVGFATKGIQLDNNNGHPRFYVGEGGSTMGTNNFIKFSSQNGLLDISTEQFQLDSSGTVFLSGSITASAGEIGGFSLGTNKISSKNLILSSSTTAGDFIISASNFNVKADGQITASNIRTDGGTVGGFTIDETSISGGGLTLKSNGQLTGSAVSMSGTIVTDDITATKGKIGGFTLGNNNLSLDAVDGAILVETGSYQSDASATKEVIYLGKIPNSGHTPGNTVQFSENKFGLAHVYFNQDADLSKVYFEIGHTQNKIAGFEFDEKTIFSGTEISMSSANGGSINLNNGSIVMSGSGLLNISSSVESPAVIKLNSDGATKGVDIDSTQGIIGHGDITNREFETHNGQFRFTEDSISTGGGNGITYDITSQDNEPLSTDFGTGGDNINNEQDGSN